MFLYVPAYKSPAAWRHVQCTGAMMFRSAFQIALQRPDICVSVLKPMFWVVRRSKWICELYRLHTYIYIIRIARLRVTRAHGSPQAYHRLQGMPFLQSLARVWKFQVKNFVARMETKWKRTWNSKCKQALHIGVDKVAEAITV